MKRLLRRLAKRGILRACLSYMYGRDAILLLLGRGALIYSERAGALASGPGFQRAVVMALNPDESGLRFALNAMKGFAANGFFVLAVSSRRLPNEMSENILGGCHHLIERYSIGRDFGSYKLGFSWLKRQEFYSGIETLALVNDSMYYPQSVADTIKEMLQEDAPWLALSENREGHYHAQSFFQLFRSPVFRSRAFERFFKSYVAFSVRSHAIDRGEVGLSQALVKSGFFPFVLYNTNRIRESVSSLFSQSSPPGIWPILLLTLGRCYRDQLERYHKSLKRLSHPGDAFTSALAEERTLFVTELCTWIARLAESKNPTHCLGLLCNYVYTAPIKRDLCYRDVHSMADVLALAQGFDAREKMDMAIDLRRKGNPHELRRIRRLLYDAGLL